MRVTRIACAQLAPVLGDLTANLEMSTAAIAQAVSAGAQIVVLPELVTSGYLFADADDARAVALSAGDPAFENWVAAAGEAVVIGGFCELADDGTLHNSALVIDRGAVAGCYRKTHLWDREKLIFTPGDRLPPVLATRFGAIAVMICYDLEFPEVTREVAVQGAELIAAPVNWPRMPRPDGARIGEVITAMSAARTNRIAIAVCDRAGVDRGQQWAEGTAIINADGWVVAEVGAGTGLATAEVDLSASHDKKITDYVNVLADRRLDLY
jgi:predicted amidohydrolase